MHYDLTISRNRRARLWIDDCPQEAQNIGDKVMQATLTVAPAASKQAKIAVEVSVNTGPRVQYGLIGADFTPREGTDLHVSVPYSESAGPTFTTPLTLTKERAHGGLLPEYASAVLGSLRAMTENGVCQLSGKLTIRNAAHTETGSSQAMFTRLTQLLVAIMQDPSAEKDRALERLVAGDLFDMRGRGTLTTEAVPSKKPPSP